MNRLELQIAVDAGMSIAQLAKRFQCSKGSVRYWLAKYEMKTKNRSKQAAAPQAIAAREAGSRSYVGMCPTHGETEFVRRDGGLYRCARCRVDAVTARRRRVKEMLVLEAGGNCQICGYDRYAGALQFHHLDPSEKSFALARRGLAMSIDLARAEVRKCVLLCANCHAEVEGGVTRVSLH
jgi:hypothetical protein